MIISLEHDLRNALGHVRCLQDMLKSIFLPGLPDGQGHFCPFCGWKPKIEGADVAGAIFVKGLEGRKCHIVCPQCHATGPVTQHPTSAVAAWNIRYAEWLDEVDWEALRKAFNEITGER
jgi:hypothetical protein